MHNFFDSDKHFVLKNSDGKIDTVLPGESVILETSVGKLIPRYTLDEESRKKEAPVKFYRSGELKSLPLEEITPIKTSIGQVKAELLTFYKSGALRRLFPLNGKISGFWTEENEYELAETIDIPTSAGILSLKPIYLQFYETGELESIGFWPKERVTIDFMAEKIEIRKGLSFYKNGSIKGFEPLREIEVNSFIGRIKVFDPDPNGLSAESNALEFYENGGIKSIVTSHSEVHVINDGSITRYAPAMVSSYCNESAFFIAPLKIIFDSNTITFINKTGSKSQVSAFLEFEVNDFVPEKPVAEIGCS